MNTGYSKTPLAKKLGLKTGYNYLLYKAPKHYFNLFTDLPESITECSISSKAQVDFIHVFCLTQNELETVISTYKPLLKLNGMLWVSWPKGNSKIKTNLKREPIRELLLKTGLVDIKVAAIDKDWSGLKFVYRLKDRH